jgi:hypothetical protein
MPHPLLLSLALASGLGHAPSAPIESLSARPIQPSLPSLAEALASAAPPPLAPPQDYNYGLAPRGWVSVGISFVSSEIDQDTVDDPDDERPLGADVGLYGWQGEVGMGLELGAMHSTYEAVGGDSLSDPSEEIDVWRLMLGVRIADRGSGDRLLPWARGGFLYRIDDGEGVDPQGASLADDGPGFYVGAGFDLVLIAGFAFTPQVMYQKSKSFDSEEWIGTLSLSYLF